MVSVTDFVSPHPKIVFEKPYRPPKDWRTMWIHVGFTFVVQGLSSVRRHEGVMLEVTSE